MTEAMGEFGVTPTEEAPGASRREPVILDERGQIIHQQLGVTIGRLYSKEPAQKLDVPAGYRVSITFGCDDLSLKNLAFLMTALDELHGILVLAMASRLGEEAPADRSPRLVSVIKRSPLTVELVESGSGRRVLLAALRVFAAVLREPGRLETFLPPGRAGWYEPRATEHEARLRLETIRRLGGEIAVRVPGTDMASENKALQELASPPAS
jgi:hypothetical protein